MKVISKVPANKYLPNYFYCVPSINYNDEV